MIIAHNLSAMNANRMFNINNKKRASMTEKLSSGYKINRSADDAAGLAISEKMRRQIRGLDQGAKNIQEGISLVQVADGALNETHDILQRMNELAVKAANGTNTSDDREYIQCEIEQLIEEVDRIANTTSYNEEICPLRGTASINSVGSVGGTLPSYLSIQNFSVINTQGRDVKWDGVTYLDGESFSGSYVLYDARKNSESTNPMLHGLFKYGTTGGVVGRGYDLTMVDFTAMTAGVQVGGGVSVTGWGTEPDGVIYFTTSDSGKIYCGIANDGVDFAIDTVRISDHEDLYFRISMKDTVNNETDGIWIQMGTEPGQGMFVDLVDATAGTLGIEDVDVTTQDNACAAISAIKNAINTVSKYRSNFGAQQNRLEHGYNANLNTVENTTASESQIRDTDMAMEMVAFSNSNIIAQAGQAMLAQANQMNQDVLALLG